MNILVDECCPPTVVEVLEQDGHDVVYIARESSGLSDADILKQSVIEERVIVTEDRDFCELVFRDALPAYGIVLVRIHPARRQEKAARVSELFSKHAVELPHAITTLTLTRIRVRSLPKAH